MSDAFTLIATFNPKPGQEQRLADALNALIEPSLAEAGCLGYRPLADPNRPGAMVIIEEWVSEQALREHGATPHFRHASEIFDEILVEPLGVTKLARV